VERSELPEVHGIDVGAVVDEQLRHLEVSVGAGVVQGHQPALVLQLQKQLKSSKTKIIQKIKNRRIFFYWNSWVQKKTIRISQCFGYSLLRAEGFSCSLDVLHGAIYDQIFGHQNHGSGMDPDPDSMNPDPKHRKFEQ
jgi:hypothetical protein